LANNLTFLEKLEVAILFLKSMQNIMGMHIPISLHGNKFMEIMEVMRSYFIPRKLYTQEYFFLNLITNMGIIIS